MSFKKARVSGTVTYVNDIGQRVPVPIGPCEISDSNEMGPYFLRWLDNGSYKVIELTLHEYAHYKTTKNFVILE